MSSDRAEKVDETDLAEPVGVVRDRDGDDRRLRIQGPRGGVCIGPCEEGMKLGGDGGDVVGQNGMGLRRSLDIPPRWITDRPCRPSHQQHDAMPMTLEVKGAEQRREISEMKRPCGRIYAQVDRTRSCQVFSDAGAARLRDEIALLECVDDSRETAARASVGAMTRLQEAQAPHRRANAAARDRSEKHFRICATVGSAS